MRYIKVLLLVLIFFLSMVFFVQNQGPLSQKLTLELDLLFFPLMKSIPLPLYFLLLASFMIGALVCFLILVWDKVNLTAKVVKNNWRIHALEKELEKIKAATEGNTSEQTTSETTTGKEKTSAQAPQPALLPPSAETVGTADELSPDPDKSR